MPQRKDFSPQTQRRMIALIKLYEIADLRLSALIDKALSSGTSAQLRYRRRVQAQVQQILTTLREESGVATTSVLRSAYDDGLLVAHPNEGRRSIKGVFGGVHKQSVEVLTNSLESSLKDAQAVVGRRVDDIFRRETLKAIAEQLATGATKPEAARALETALQRQGTTAFVDRAGRQWTLRNYSSMAVATVTREAMSTATKNRMLENGHDLIEIDKHPHPPDACSPYDGKVFSLTGATKGYPVIDKLPPFHPRCAHNAFPSRLNFLTPA